MSILAEPNFSELISFPPTYDAEQVKTEFHALADDEKNNVARGIAAAIGGEGAMPQLRDAAKEAAQAVRNVDRMLESLREKVGSLGHDVGQFMSGFDRTRAEFHEAVNESRTFAIQVSHYCTEFDEIVTQVSTDNSIPAQERAEAIEHVAKRAEHFKFEAERTAERFKRLTERFSHLVQSTSQWAAGREGELQGHLNGIDGEIADINASIAKLESPLAVIATGLGVVSVIGAVGSMGIVAAKAKLMYEKRGKERDADAVRAEIYKIQEARRRLEASGRDDLEVFALSISVLSQVWSFVTADAQRIQVWLRDGAKATDMPMFIKVSLQKGVAIYKNLAQYLEAYAHDIMA